MILPAKCFIMITCIAYHSTLMMVAVRFSEISMNFYQATRCYMPEDSNLYSQCYENVKINMVMNLQVPQKRETSRLNERLYSKEALGCIVITDKVNYIIL